MTHRRFGARHYFVLTGGMVSLYMRPERYVRCLLSVKLFNNSDLLGGKPTCLLPALQSSLAPRPYRSELIGSLLPGPYSVRIKLSTTPLRNIISSKNHHAFDCRSVHLDPRRLIWHWVRSRDARHCTRHSSGYSFLKLKPSCQRSQELAEILPG